MLPKASTAGLATGCRLSAIGMPMSHAPGFAEMRIAAGDHQLPAAAPSGTLTMTSVSEPMMTGAATSPMVTRGRSVLANPLLCLNLQLTACDGGHRLHLRDFVGRPSDDFRIAIGNKIVAVWRGLVDTAISQLLLPGRTECATSHRSKVWLDDNRRRCRDTTKTSKTG